jgi:hypothetical protein
MSIEVGYACVSCLVYGSGEKGIAAGATSLLLVVFVFDVEVFGVSVKIVS